MVMLTVSDNILRYSSTKEDMNKALFVRLRPTDNRA